MYRATRWVLYLLTATLLSACSGSDSKPAASLELTVSAASSLTEAFTQAGTQFERANPGTHIIFNFAGSDKLAQQIGEGAPVDVFASANTAQMAKAITSGRIISGTQQIFARNRLIVVFPKANRAGIQALSDLARPGIKIVLANPQVPIGSYSLSVFGKASLLPEYTATYSQSVLANVVSYEENVRAVLGKVALDEADAGIVYSSDVTSAAAQNIGQIAIPDGLNTIASYPIAVIRDRPNTALAQRFVAYILSPDGQKIMAEHGFIPTSDP